MRTIAAIGVLFIPGINVYAAGFVSGMIASGGDLKSGIISGLAAGAFHGVGTHFDKLAKAAGGTLSAAQRVAKVVAHGVVGGVSSVANSGKFLSGFLAAGAVQSFSLSGGFEALGGVDPSSAAFGSFDYVHNAAIGAIVGGTAAVLGGGKFGNGAVTGAFSRLFNDVAHGSIPLTVNEQEMLSNGNVEGFYESRLARGDRYAKTALGVIRGNTFLGRVANAQLLLATHFAVMDGVIIYPAATPEEFLRQVNLGLAQKHVMSVNFDFNEKLGDVLGLLSPGQIQSYHEAYFKNTGLSADTFSGAIFGFNNNAVLNWCPGCDRAP